ncbi:Pancreatic lipase-related protein 2 [Blattella germanica]|nr:Pancreatic lipase-related protein 2 [Blattella germanica]
MKKNESSVCYNELGCFSAEEPWSSALRPVPLPEAPEEIQTRFYLYTRFAATIIMFAMEK